MTAALRCPRCLKGNVVAEPDAGGHILDLKCLLCGRSPGEYTREQFRVLVKNDEDMVKRASEASFSCLWVV